jgi:hypothetical protein
MTKLQRAILAVVACGGAAACNFTKLAAEQTVGVFSAGSQSYQRENDVELAHHAGLANLKLLEGLLEVIPEDEELLALCARSYAEFAFAFVETELEQLSEDDAKYAPTLARAVDFYGRARKYASRRLKQTAPEVVAALAGPVDKLERALASVEKEQADALFWVGYPWGGIINLQIDDPAALVDVPKAIAIMKRVVALDEKVYHGAAHLFLGGVYSSVPPSLGGDPAASLTHFERATELTEGNYLLGKVLFATYYWAKSNPDRARFEALLNEVLAADLEAHPDIRLANTIAQRRAQMWLDRADEVF